MHFHLQKAAETSSRNAILIEISFSLCIEVLLHNTILQGEVHSYGRPCEQGTDKCFGRLLIVTQAFLSIAMPYRSNSESRPRKAGLGLGSETPERLRIALKLSFHRKKLLRKLVHKNACVLRAVRNYLAPLEGCLFVLHLRTANCKFSTMKSAIVST